MKPWISTIVWATWIVVLTVAGGHANEESTLLTNQGLVQLDAGDTAAARKQFRAAVEADPSDEDARYYLAHTYSLAGEYQQALDTLGNHTFEYWDADYLRGVSHMGLGQRDAAFDAFSASATADNPRALFYVGLIHYQRGDMAQAKQALRAAGELDADLEPYRRLYLGLIARGDGNEPAAERYFASLQKDAPGSPAAELAAEAGRVAPPDDESKAPEPAAKKTRKKYVFFDLRLSQELDSNPGLVQSNDDLARVYHPDLTGSTSALRTGLYMGLRGRWGDADGFSGQVGGSGFATLHAGNPDAKAFNAVQPRGFLTLAYGKDKWSIFTPGSYSRTYLGALDGLERYNDIIAAGAGFDYAFSPKLHGRTGVYYENQDFGSGQERNGNSLAVPLEVIAPLHKKLRVSGGYTLSVFLTDQGNSPWQFVGNRLHVGALTAPHRDLLFFATFAYFNRQYANDWPDPVLGQLSRSDNELSVELGGRYNMTKHADIAVTYDGTFQESIATFTYNRHVVGVSVGLSL